ncbi:myosin-M heavy chain [Trichonephila clavipes]|nr:myosin-M heavy chain [Trichonephila clavipes]
MYFLLLTRNPIRLTRKDLPSGNEQNTENTSHAVGFNSTKSENTTSTTLPKNGVPSPAASLEAITSPRGKSNSDSGDQSTPQHHSASQSAPATPSSNPENTKSDDSYMQAADGATRLDDSYALVKGGSAIENKYPSLSIEGATTNQDDSSSESSYMSLPYEREYSDTGIYGHLNASVKLKDITQDTELKENIYHIPENTTASVTCTIINKDKNNEDISRSKTSPSQNESQITDMKALRNSSNTIEESNKKTPDGSSSDEEPPPPTEIEGPLYSNLLYVPRKSPSPPPLPTSLPPLPPKKKNLPQIVHIGKSAQSFTASESDDEGLYDVLPMKSSPKPLGGDSIYESRRYSDTGATIVTIASGASDVVSEHIYCSLGSDEIYEEVPDNNGDRKEIIVSVNPFGRHRRSFFEGASKAEILKFLEGAKERVVDHLGEDDILDEDEDDIPQTKNVRNNPIRISNISSSSDSSSISCNSSASRDGSSCDEISLNKNGRIVGNSEVERADSGVGSETSKPAVSRRAKPDVEELCADCDQQLEGISPDQLNCCPLVCKKCDKKRSERKEIVTEIVETEFKYGKDLIVIKEEFKAPMEVAGLLTKEQLNGVFLNLDELILVNAQFSEKLKDATDIAAEQGDEVFMCFVSSFSTH